MARELPTPVVDVECDDAENPIIYRESYGIRAIERRLGQVKQEPAALQRLDELIVAARREVGTLCDVSDLEVISTSLTDGMGNFAERLGGDDDAVKTWRAEPPTPHDLRRTVETRLASMGVPREIRDAVLNHAMPGVGSKHYNRYDFAAEKRAALNRWALAVAAILDPVAAPVVDLADARKGVRR
jgi:integrase